MLVHPLSSLKTTTSFEIKVMKGMTQVILGAGFVVFGASLALGWFVLIYVNNPLNRISDSVSTLPERSKSQGQNAKPVDYWREVRPMHQSVKDGISKLTTPSSGTSVSDLQQFLKETSNRLLTLTVANEDRSEHLAYVLSIQRLLDETQSVSGSTADDVIGLQKKLQVLISETEAASPALLTP